MMKKLIGPLQRSLAIPAMDEENKAFAENIKRLIEAPEHTFRGRLFALITGMERDVREEEKVMEEIGFPALQSHREQHASILSAFHCVVPKVMQGDYALARLLLDLWPQWSLVHLLKMDT